MTILHMHTNNGGFMVGDTVSGRTAYAYPTSTHSNQAKRNPDRVAAEMIEDECLFNLNPNTELGRELIECDVRNLRMLLDRDAELWVA